MSNGGRCMNNTKAHCDIRLARLRSLVVSQYSPLDGVKEAVLRLVPSSRPIGGGFWFRYVEWKSRCTKPSGCTVSGLIDLRKLSLKSTNRCFFPITSTAWSSNRDR